MTGWLEFANRPMPVSQHLLHVAIAHHRFLWIHPFGNGNGRVTRLLSYAMLRRHGFMTGVGVSTVNPTAVFGSDREGYYAALHAADALDNDGTVTWCTFFVQGMQRDLERLALLHDVTFVRTKLIGPVIDRMLRSGDVTARDATALRIALDRDAVRARDLEDAFPGSPSQRSVAIRSLLERGLLRAERPNARRYRLHLGGQTFSLMLVRQLDTLGLLPPMLSADAP